ncbi:MAG: hypothetical protein RIQ30_1568 [Pseudomonadota bacterium]
MDLIGLLQPHLIPAGLGVFVGLIMALTGAGGGILSVPLLVFILHLPMVEASPIGLLAVTVSSALGAILALRTGLLRYRAAMLLALAGLLLSPAGLWLAHQIPNRIFVEAYQQSKGIFKEPKAVPCSLDLSIGRLIWTVPCARALIGSGALAGFLSGLLGVGGGFVIVPALKRISDLPMQSIVATSLGVLSLISLGGVAGSGLAGTMNWLVAIPFAFGAITGMMAGRLIAPKVSSQWTQLIFAGFSGLVAIGLIVKAL